MSFLSSLLCCFGSDTSDRNDDNGVTVRNRQKKRSNQLSPEQSNIQKSLSASLAGDRSNIHNQSNDSGNNKLNQHQKGVPVVQRQATTNTTTTANTTNDGHYPHHQSKPSATELTATAKDSSDSSKDTQSIIAHDETTISGNENATAADIDAIKAQQAEILHLKNNHIASAAESGDNIADNEQDEDDQNEHQTEMNSISTSSSEEYEKAEELDLTKFQPGQSFASSGWLLDPPTPELAQKKCLVLDLDETLVHSSFKYVRQADFVLPVEIEGQVHNVYVIKRPGVDEFLRKVCQWYEVVVFTASVARYGDPLLDILDRERTIHHRLFRDSCYNYQGNYIKNLSQIGRDLKNLIIIDNSPASYIFHPQHAVPISSWFSDTHDCELLDILPLLHDLSGIDDVRLSLDINL